MVDARGTEFIYREEAKKSGLALHLIPISDSVAQASLAESIRGRSTDEKREQWHKYSLTEGKRYVRHALEMVREGTLQKATDYWAPTLMVFRKPRSANTPLKK